MNEDENIDNIAQTFFLLMVLCSLLSDTHVVIHERSSKVQYMFDCVQALFIYAFTEDKNKRLLFENIENKKILLNNEINSLNKEIILEKNEIEINDFKKDENQNKNENEIKNENKVLKEDEIKNSLKEDESKNSLKEKMNVEKNENEINKIKNEIKKENKKVKEIKKVKNEKKKEIVKKKKKKQI